MRGRFAAAAGLCLLIGGGAAAMQAPMFESDLDKNSDVIASVRVLAVASTGTAGGGAAKVPVCQAWLLVVKPTKGPVKERETVLVQWQDVPKNLVGPWK